MKSVYRIGAALWDVIKNYPLPMLAALMAFAFIGLQIHATNPLVYSHKNALLGLTLECFGAMLLFLTADILVRWNQLDRAKQWGLYLLVVCCLGLHFYSVDPAYFESDVFVSRYAIFFAIYFLSIGVATYVSPASDDLFWNYNFHFFRTLVQSVGFSVVLLLGLLSAFWAIDMLFGMNFHEKGYMTIIAFVLVIAHSFLFLVFFPKGPSDLASEFNYPEWLRVLAQYILLPVVLIYGTFLYIYVFKILMENRMPNGWVSIPILLYSGAGFLAYSLLYPFRNDQENRMVYPFMRYFFYTLLPLLTLYFIAIYLRINLYGVTENRYMLAMMGLWLTAICLYRMFNHNAPLAIIPQSLLLLFLLSVIGPWGMYQWSIRSQSKRLRHLLVSGAYLQKNGVDLSRPFPPPAENQALAFRSVLTYLNNRNQLKQLHPFLNATHQQWLSQQLDSGQQETVMALLYNRFGLNNSDNPNANTARFFAPLAWGTHRPMLLQQAGRLIAFSWRDNNFIFDGDSTARYSLRWQHDTLVCLQANYPTSYFPLQLALKQLRTLHANALNDTSASSEWQGQAPIALPDSLNPLVFHAQQLYVNEWHIRWNATADSIERLQAYWFIPNQQP